MGTIGRLAIHQSSDLGSGRDRCCARGRATARPAGSAATAASQLKSTRAGVPRRHAAIAGRRRQLEACSARTGDRVGEAQAARHAAGSGPAAARVRGRRRRGLPAAAIELVADDADGPGSPSARGSDGCGRSRARTRAAPRGCRPPPAAASGSPPACRPGERSAIRLRSLGMAAERPVDRARRPRPARPRPRLV